MATASDIFKTPGEAQFLASALTISSIPILHGLPEVVVAGRANVGKSTLLNAVMGRKNLVRTSKKAGQTNALNFFRIGNPPNTLILVDSPGYGKRGRREWGELWDHYIQNRPQLRRVYLLINAKHGVTDVDKMMLEDLEDKFSLSGTTSGKPLRAKLAVQPVLTQIDAISSRDFGEASKAVANMQADVRKSAPSSLACILTACSKEHTIGVDALRVSMAECVTNR